MAEQKTGVRCRVCPGEIVEITETVVHSNGDRSYRAVYYCDSCQIVYRNPRQVKAKQKGDDDGTRFTFTEQQRSAAGRSKPLWR